MKKFLSITIALIILLLTGCNDQSNSPTPLSSGNLDRLIKHEYEQAVPYVNPKISIQANSLTMQSIDQAVAYGDNFILSGSYSETVPGGDSSMHAVVCMIDKNGSTIWQNEYGNENLTIVTSIATDGKLIYLCGYSNSSSYSQNKNNVGFIICIDGSGKQIFQSIYSNPDSLCSFSDIALFDEYLLTVGMIYHDETSYALVCAFDYSGNMIWETPQNQATMFCEAQKIAKNADKPTVMLHYYNESKSGENTDMPALSNSKQAEDNIIMKSSSLSQAKIVLFFDNDGKALSGFPLTLPITSNKETKYAAISAVDFDVTGDVIAAAGTVSIADNEGNDHSIAVTAAYDSNGRILWSDNVYGNNGSGAANLWISDGDILVFGRRYDAYSDIENYNESGNKETLPDGPIYIIQYSKDGNIVSKRLLHQSEYKEDALYYMTNYFPSDKDLIAIR